MNGVGVAAKDHDESQNNLSSNDINQMQLQRHGLMEKKKEKWNQDKSKPVLTMIEI